MLKMCSVYGAKMACFVGKKCQWYLFSMLLDNNDDDDDDDDNDDVFC